MYIASSHAYSTVLNNAADSFFFFVQHRRCRACYAGVFRISTGESRVIVVSHNVASNRHDTTYTRRLVHSHGLSKGLTWHRQL